MISNQSLLFFVAASMALAVFSVVSSVESSRNLLFSHRFNVREKFCCFPYKVKLRYMN